MPGTVKDTHRKAFTGSHDKTNMYNSDPPLQILKCKLYSATVEISFMLFAHIPNWLQFSNESFLDKSEEGWD